MKLLFIFFAFNALLFNCLWSRNNYDEAVICKIDNDWVLKIKRRQFYNVHDPLSLLLREKYNDSVLFKIPDPTIKRLNGAEIKVPAGQYGYAGYIDLGEKNANVNLLYVNSDDNRFDKTEWNGAYRLKRAY
ncbi:hypothetical protein [Hymenobacter sp. DG25A]|uniref:hypothetical protein n=1 Tax=Hymenobacter sp. DG25A TaxID=1385663 RepID=UPI000AE69F16|nr:hypothetical protein [Hymenobacter sp. DG25A]